ncbi:PREDICTED: disintegrin and metalloproteinase domain-containing protein 33 [Elephantulus edwardii]|uniref:disintegrin and metalloproteinase domain-containing protein 33 n=1 Tax=Elephantulus edwardii TaxID=28737 RepID=UPI0003F07A37|nr:PREDICTED: disintegrin and metalloproteinase domain-containing protein 33 [Elephantulus edwardii]
MGRGSRDNRGSPVVVALLLLWPSPGRGALSGDAPGETATPYWALDGQSWRKAILEESESPWHEGMEPSLQVKDVVSDLDTRLVTLEAEGQKLLLELEKNHKLLAGGYTETHYSQDGQPVVLVPRHTAHCHYHGHVRGYPDSWVVLSTCFGMSGLIVLGTNTSYYLRSWPSEVSTSPWIHKIAPAQQPLRWEGACAHRDTSDKSDPAGLARVSPSRGRREARGSPRYLELYLVADHALFLAEHGKLNHTKQRLLEVAHYVDQFLRTLDIQVALTGLEVWTKRDLSLVTQDANATLWAFLRWRRGLWAQRPHDSTQLLTARTFQGATVGLAPVAGMCSKESSGGVSTDHAELPIGAAATMAHEIGHSLGLSHDPEGCCVEAPAEQGGCVMAAVMGRPFPRVFSACSRRQLRAFFRKGGGSCLSNAPDPQLRVPRKPSRCGNGLVEAGEECDCGALQDCPDSCCIARNCSLRAGAQCAHGACCTHCLLKPAGAPCRPATGDCDLPEFCTGFSPHCPPDVYLLDGSPCAGGLGYCWDGGCPTLEQQCQRLWGPSSHPAPEACFQIVNSAGDAHGNCGQDSQGHFVPCAPRDAQCGKLQCWAREQSSRMPHAIPMDAAISLDSLEVTCREALEPPGTPLDLPNLGLVEMGTWCGPGMVCQDRRCQNSTFQKLERCQASCHAHGVCNSNYNCHCAPGWAPPSCSEPGLGGSVDSGPLQPEGRDAFVLALGLSFLLPLLPGFGLAWCCFRYPGSCLRQHVCASRTGPTCSRSKADTHRDIRPVELGPMATGVPSALDHEDSASVQQPP